MTRRSFITVTAGGLLARPLGAGAQPAKPVRIGVLRAAPDGVVFREGFELFRQVLRGNGFVEGANFTIEYRVRAGSAEEIATLAGELAHPRIDAIVAIGPAAVRAAAAATKSIPIVAVDLESDPVAEGFVGSLGRPGGNLTGLFLDFPALSGKWIELLKEMVPRLSRIGVLWDPTTPPNLLKGAGAAAGTLRVEIFPVEARAPEELAPAFRSAVEKRAGGVLVLSSPLFYSARAQIVAMAARHRAPTIMPFPEFAEDGGLMAYGASVPGMYRQAGDVMVKVLRSGRPGDIPIERPARFELIVNRKTAASLGLVVPRSLFARADKVIE
ncbi:MAG TPA: ABC transporter substrate-binding protein [Methylomirabilota bacterium]|nr:ABC transporter substrate-binding protein [Methylomirabilota bacterium]